MKSNTLSAFKMKQAAIESFFDEIKGFPNEENVGIGGVNTAISNFLKALEEVKEKKMPKISLWRRFMNFIRSLFRSNRKRGQNDAVIEKVESKELKETGSVESSVESKDVESVFIPAVSVASAVATPMTISSEQSNTLVPPPLPSPLFAAASSSSFERIGAVKDTEKKPEEPKEKTAITEQTIKEEIKETEIKEEDAEVEMPVQAQVSTEPKNPEGIFGTLLNNAWNGTLYYLGYEGDTEEPNDPVRERDEAGDDNSVDSSSFYSLKDDTSGSIGSSLETFNSKAEASEQAADAETKKMLDEMTRQASQLSKHPTKSRPKGPSRRAPTTTLFQASKAESIEADNNQDAALTFSFSL